MYPHFPTCRHTVLFYRDPDAVRASVAAFVETALRGGNPALVIAKADLRRELTIELHRRHVHGLPFGRDRGQLQILDAEATLQSLCVDGHPDATRFRQVVGSLVAGLSMGHRRVAAYGEMVGVLCERGQYADAVHLESLWNALLAENDVSLFCGYASGLFDRPEARSFYDEIRAAHAESLEDAGATARAHSYSSRTGSHESASSVHD
jgi:hypothetical protein